MSSSDPANAQIFSVRITPHRSLSEQNFRVLMTVFAVAVCFVTLPFFILGAWPIVGFMGLDILALWIAFRVNFRDARAYEDISLTPLELAVAKVSAKGKRQEWRFNPVWVRLQRQEDEDFGLVRLDVVSRGRSLEVAHDLDQDRKADFARDFSLALARAKRGPEYHHP